MGYIYTTTVPNGGLGNIEFNIRYDLHPVRIDIDATADIIYVSAIKAACREAECSVVGMEFDPLIDAEGLVTLLESVEAEQQTFLTITLLNSVCLNSLRDFGIVTFVGGNIVSKTKAPIVERNNDLTYLAFFSQAGVVSQVRVDTGSGLSTAEHNAVMASAQASQVAALQQLMQQMQQTQLTINQLRDIVLSRQNTIAGGRITDYIAGTGDNAVVVDVNRNAQGIPTSEVIRA